MMWALLLASFAFAQDATLQERLLGPEAPVVGPLPQVVGPAAPEVAVPQPPAPVVAEPAVTTASLLDQLEQDGAVASAGDTTSAGLPWWVPLVALAGAGAFYWTRKTAVQAEPKELPVIQVISKASLGGTAGVAIVEVEDGGRRRRLLLGTGDKQPVLLTELGTRSGLVDQIGSERTVRSPAPTGLVDEIGSERAVSRRAQGLAKALAKPRKASPSAANRPANDWMAVDPSSELGPRKAAARVLINQEMNRRTAT